MVSAANTCAYLSVCLSNNTFSVKPASAASLTNIFADPVLLPLAALH